jgi:hypothetical protein
MNIMLSVLPLITFKMMSTNRIENIEDTNGPLISLDLPNCYGEFQRHVIQHRINGNKLSV